MANGIVFSVLVVIVTAGCVCEAGDLGIWSGSVENVEGVPRVLNPGTPLLDTDDVSVELLWETRGPGDSLGFWEEPSRIVLATGTAYVLDAPASQVQVVSRDGKWHSSFGTPGEGPGELERPVTLASLGDQLVVVDGGKGSLEFFDLNGNHQRSLRIGRMVFDALPAGPHGIALFSLLGQEADWQLISMDGEVRNPHLFAASTGPGSTESTECHRTSSNGLVFTRVDCRILVFDSFDLEGELTRTVRVDRPAEAASAEALEGFLERARETMARSGLPAGLISQQLEELREHYRIIPKYRGVLVDSLSELALVWEQQPEELWDGTATVHLFTSAGAYLAVVPFPEAWVDAVFEAERLYVLARDQSSGLFTLKAYVLRLSKEVILAANEAVNRAATHDK